MKFPLGMQSKHTPTIALAASATSSGLSIAWPAGINANDLAVLFDFVSQSPSPSEVIPTGFTKISGVTLGTGRQTVSYKLCTGTETGAITGQNGTSGYIGKVLLILRGTPPIKNVAVMPVPNTGAGYTPANQVVSASGQPPAIVVLAAASANVSGGTTFQSVSPAFTAEIASTGPLRAGYNLDNLNPVDHTIGIKPVSSVYAYLTSFYLSLT